MNAYDLKCEYLVDPVGIDVKRPRLYWKCRGGKVQKAYEIQAAASEERLEENQLLWDSGRVDDWESLHIEYPMPLYTRDRVFWRVRLMDESGQFGSWSAPAMFEMGLLDDCDFHARWIDPEVSYDPQTEPPVSMLRREFNVQPGFLSARLYVSALGIYEVRLNDSRVGDQVLTPGFTDMAHRRQYQTYDVTGLLLEGDNAVGSFLADGWARGRLGFSGMRNNFSSHIALWLQLIVTYPWGEVCVLTTDGQWRSFKDGPYRLSDMRDGEVYDARRQMPGWDCAGYDDSHWAWVHEVSYGGSLVGTQSVPVKELYRIQGKRIHTPDGRAVIDFGQNIAGYVEFRVSGSAGHTVRLTHGEVLDKDGNFTMCNFTIGTDETSIVSLKQVVEYTLAGKGIETYKPAFIYMGFRYILVENWPGPVKAQDFTAIVISSDLEQTGDFNCSDANLNQFFHNVIWSQRDNFVDIPTDCPQRERMGWTGDIQIFAGTAAMNFFSASFLTKWLRDVCTSQLDNGMVLNTVPGIVELEDGRPTDRNTSCGWGDAITMIPFRLYEIYGDLRLVREMYPHMKRWVDFELDSAKAVCCHPENPYDPWVWDSGYHWGEWLEPDMEPIEYQSKPEKPEVATAYMCYSARLLGEMARILEYGEDAQKYLEISEQVRKAYVYTFTKDGVIDGGERQCLYVRPLALGLLPSEKEKAAVDRLAELLIQNDYRIGTGFLSTPYLCEVLTRGGHLEIAYKTLLQTMSPGWLYSVTRGATTTWETWAGYLENGDPVASHNHYAYGSIFEWVYEYMIGIRPALSAPAYRKFRLEPCPGGGIDHASGAIDTIRGRICCGWRQEEHRFIMDFTVPSNTTAHVVLPAEVTEIQFDGGMDFERKEGHFCAVAAPGKYTVICGRA